jgi:excisionase family DNA binding protein
MTEGTVKKSFCTTREAATLLGVSVGTVQLWVESGLLQAWKTSGGHRRVLRDSIDSLLHKGVDEATPVSVDLAPLVNSRPLNVLVVEDDDNLLRLYKTKLAQWPMKPIVSLADNGVTGLLMMGRSNPDLLITDLDMPGLDGFNMLRVLHQTPEMRHSTIVVVTGLDPAELDRRGGLPSGVEVLPKPVPFERLLAIATAVVKQRLTVGQTM